MSDKSLLTEDEMQAEVLRRGYRTVPFHNDAGLVCGFYLRGPRGHKRFITPDADGFYMGVIVSLWCDGVDYAEKKLEESRRRVYG